MSHQPPSAPNLTELRKQAGQLLKEWRQAAGLTQRDVAKAIRIEYYNFISAVEQGRTPIPENKYVAWAEAVRKDPKEFIRTIWPLYNPTLSAFLLGS